MNNTFILLERVRYTTPNKSKEQTAKALGIEPSNLRRMYRGKGYPNGMNCLQIADILRMDVRDVNAYVAADKARSVAAREAVLSKLPRLHTAASFAIAATVGTLLFSANPAQVTPDQSDPVYIMRNRLRRWRAAWGRGLDDIFGQLAAAA